MTARLAHHYMLGMRLEYALPTAYLLRFMNMAAAGTSGYMCVANVHQCVLTHDDDAFRAVVNGADFVVPDSVILERARQIRYGVASIKTRRGAELMLDICQAAEARGLPIALIGGKHEGVLDTLRNNLMARFPKLNIALAFSPPFSGMNEQEDQALCDQIDQSGARVVLVGLGCPKQENWMAAHKGKFGAMQAGVGAAFDFNAGLVKTSPQWVHRIGLEWLYRLISEPRRLWRRYFSTSPRFLYLLGLDALRALRKRTNTSR